MTEPEAQEQEFDAYERRMLNYASRQASALESLRSFAWFWTIAAVIGLLVTILIVNG